MLHNRNNHESESKKTKGINKDVVDDELKYKDCWKLLFIKSDMRNEMDKTQSKNHNISSYRINKIYFSS